MRLDPDDRVRRHAVPRLGGAARAAVGGGRPAAGPRRDLHVGGEPRRRGPHGQWRPRARPGRLGRRRGRPTARARRSGAQLAPPRRDHGALVRRGARRFPRPALRALAQLSLPALHPLDAVAVRAPPELVASPAARRGRPGGRRRRRSSGSTTSGPSRRRRRTTDVFVRAVEQAEWIRRGDHLDFEITANSYLRHMVRSLVGTMVETPTAIPGLLDGRARAEAGLTAPPWGLYLVAVSY